MAQSNKIYFAVDKQMILSSSINTLLVFGIFIQFGAGKHRISPNLSNVQDE